MLVNLSLSLSDPFFVLFQYNVTVNDVDFPQGFGGAFIAMNPKPGGKNKRREGREGREGEEGGEGGGGGKEGKEGEREGGRGGKRKYI